MRIRRSHLPWFSSGGWWECSSEFPQSARASPAQQVYASVNVSKKGRPVGCDQSQTTRLLLVDSLLTPPVFSRRRRLLSPTSLGGSAHDLSIDLVEYYLLLLAFLSGFRWVYLGNRLGTAFRLSGRSISPLVASTIIRRNESTRQTIQSADPTLTVHLFRRSSSSKKTRQIFHKCFLFKLIELRPYSIWSECRDQKWCLVTAKQVFLNRQCAIESPI